MLSLPNPIKLGSKSPRRKEIMKLAGFEFEVVDIDFDEKIPHNHSFKIEEIPSYLAEQKALHYTERKGDEILITADTLVFLHDDVIGKPRDKEDAFNILQRLSGKMHQVITGVCIITEGDKFMFHDISKVYFKPFELRELEFYIDNYEVMDKAGAYSVQDWLGVIGIEKIEGSYFNVMGLPVHKVYEALKVIANH
ncbi:MAG: septum formation protein Maf [Sphingobacteriales bacterium]|nr:MAG: septum formation protein Maf [Sphingobacteriales bacterium]